MRIMSVDLGMARTGVALCDPAETLASPLCVIHERREDQLLEELARIAKEQGAERIVVGLPKNMDGSSGERAQACQAMAERLEAICGIQTVLFDERCTTVSAHQYLNATDTRGKKRKQVVDAVAAVIILEDYIRYRKNNGEE